MTLTNFEKSVTGSMCLFYIIVFGFYLWSYIYNIVKLCNCDWSAPWKDEVIHGIGVVIPAASLVTVWF